MMAIVSKMFCSSSKVVLTVRKRPHVVSGGGFVVENAASDSSSEVVFRADGCGILGKKGELILRDSKNLPLLLIYQQQGKIQALSPNQQWKGFTLDYEGFQKQAFSLKDPKSCFGRSSSIRICTKPRISTTKSWDFEVNGSFSQRACTLIDSSGNIAAQVQMKKEVELMTNKDMYNVVVNPGIDQAFVIGVIAVLDYIYHESTSC